jgi:hypothetical protein
MLAAMEKLPANDVPAACTRRPARAAAAQPPPQAKGRGLASLIRPAPEKQDSRRRRAGSVPRDRELRRRPRANCRRLKARRPRERQGGTVCTAPRQHRAMGIDDGEPIGVPLAPGGPRKGARRRWRAPRLRRRRPCPPPASRPPGCDVPEMGRAGQGPRLADPASTGEATWPKMPSWTCFARP